MPDYKNVILRTFEFNRQKIVGVRVFENTSTESKSLDIKGYYFDDESNMLPSNRGGSLPLSKKGIDMTIDVLATAVVMTGVQEKKFLEHLKNARKKVK